MIIILILILLLSFHYSWFLSCIKKGIIRLKERKNNNDSFPRVSIIIPYKNESENILNCAASLGKVKYPEDLLEIIFVNDSSEDDSAEKLQMFNMSGNVRLLDYHSDEKFRATKKDAVEYGVSKANGEIIVLTDADCEHRENWLTSIISRFDSSVAMVAGPVAYNSGENVFEELQQLEFAGLILAGAGLIGIGKPATCSAANLAFRKESFNKVDGYKGNKEFSSGDDEFLMHKFDEADFKIDYAFDTEAVVFTKPNKSVDDFKEQRTRWASKGLFYKDKMLVLKLALIFLFYLGIPLQIVFGFLGYSWLFASLLVTLMLKVIFEYRVMTEGKGILFEKRTMRLMYLAELFQIPYIILAPILGAMGNFTWKGKKVKR